MERIERGIGHGVLERVQASWEGWRGRAIEPVIRESIERLALGIGPNGQSGVVGGYWTRSNNPEIDIVVADREPIARAVYGVGSIKWREHDTFDVRHLTKLTVHRSLLPGATEDTPLVVASRSGFSATPTPGVHVFGPDELLEAWR